ncbi:Hypothetical predicted protein [Octopus vulgaris]|uniref:Transmembrane protein n=1 Tax=Octopus vulgaris TaxID=6645 RepID=A0AA36AGE0_OCTVU|nr:Hypothetical predicted protein [Octopus vulgaris]
MNGPRIYYICEGNSFLRICILVIVFVNSITVVTVVEVSAFVGAYTAADGYNIVVVAVGVVTGHAGVMVVLFWLLAILLWMMVMVELVLVVVLLSVGSLQKSKGVATDTLG